jgi:non-canonical poly(A) RNA polymerase PAPD5/7
MAEEDPLATDDAYIPFAYGMPEMANSPGHALKLIPKHTPMSAAQPLALDDFVPFGEVGPEPEDEPQAAATAGAVAAAASDLCWSPGSVYGGDSVLLTLHEDVMDFWQAFQPTQQEAEARAELLVRIRILVEELWPGAEVKPFGSYATGLYLPSSDVDIVVFGMGLETKPSRVAGLEQLAQRLEAAEWRVTELEVIGKAKVPIVKFIDVRSGVHVDICLEVRDGIQSSNLARKASTQFPAFKYLVLVLKRWLAQRGLADTYHGGVGSFLLQLLVIAALQHPPSSPDRLKGSLGGLLLHFFEVFGLRFNYIRCGISITQGGRFFSKQRHQPSFFDPANPARLCVENPLDPSVDCGAPAWNISQLRHACCNSYMRLLSLVGGPGGGGGGGGGGGRLRVLGILLDVRDDAKDGTPP